MEGVLRDLDLWSLNDSLGNNTLGNGTGGNQTVNPLKRNEEVAKVEVTVLALVLFLALAGNLCVLLAIHTTKHAQSRMYYFMKHLSIADLVVAIFQVLPQLIWDITFRFYGPDFLCRLVKYLQIVGMFASTYMLVLMSVDRCLAICQPLRSLHRRKDRFYVIASWALSLLFSIPQMYIFSMRDVGSGVYDCWGDFVQPWGAKAYMWSAWDPAAPREAMPFIISMLLASLNSCCNPWIYMYFAGHLFHDLRQRFLCCSRLYVKSSHCTCERESSRKSNSSNYAIKSTSSQKSITQTSTT
ncbi:hypothetical protein MATL_G00075870 [Megalops atlanticus]|uniref:G-protein coupled receptors family 1 profile domain-containing protein n=1 Tax=Megalops atlanticus TaxID=7932 RepID=A0A9D3T9B2_MEGAT|nr:hypothetical protein MATL_G00075870 [Megalops atlanticus]